VYKRQGLQRIASLNALTEFVKGLLKLGLVAAVMTALLMPTVTALETWSAASLTATVNYAMRLLVRLSGAVAALMTVLAILDYVYQRFSFMKQMRMTKQELRDELKQSDGDPVIKSRIRRLRQERAKKRMMAAVPGAAVVITNPTHYAVALAYEMETMPAPKVVAKGVDVLARRSREVAEANGVPIVENPPLARALHGPSRSTTRFRPSTTRRWPRSSASLCGQDREARRRGAGHLQPKTAGARSDRSNQFGLTIGAGLAENLLEVLADGLIGET
jgi:flagellar biosynthetic protein FlhB